MNFFSFDVITMEFRVGTLYGVTAHFGFENERKAWLFHVIDIPDANVIWGPVLSLLRLSKTVWNE